MADKMTSEQRHRCMSRIRGKDTRPEMLVRRFLWHKGYRYRLHDKSLPGTPDIVVRRLKIAIFVNGCFWHGHRCTKHLPSSNRKFWFDKITNNRARDLRNSRLLEAAGWMVITIWECELKKDALDETLNRLLNTISLIDDSRRCGYYATGASPSIAADDETEYE